MAGLSLSSALSLSLAPRGGGGAPATWKLAGTRGMNPTATGGTGINSLVHTSRTLHYLGPATCTALRFYYANIYIDTTSYERGPGADTTLKVGVLIPSMSGTAVALKWSGVDSKVLANGAGPTASDELMPSDFGPYVKFDENAPYWLVAERTNVNGDTRVFAGFTGTGTPSGEGAVTGPAGNPSQVLTTTALTTPAGGATNSSLFLPFAIVGLSSNHRTTGVGTPTLIVGDSIDYGQGETTLGAGDGASSGGFWQRGLYSATTPTPYILMARPATSMYGYNRLSARRASVYQFANDAICGYGRNDIDATNVTDAIFLATISGTTMTVSEMREGTTIVAGDKVQGSGISGSPLIQAFGTAGTTGTGGAGTYALSTSQTVASSTLLSCAKNTGRTAAQMETEYETFYDALKTAGVLRVFQRTLPPKTTSTDSWVTTANQTVTSPNRYQAGDALFDANAIIAAVSMTGQDGAILIAEALRDATEQGKWGVDAGVARTVDGLHPNPNGYSVAAPVVTSWRAAT